MEKQELTLESLAALVTKQNETIATLQGQLLKSQTVEEVKAPSIPKEPVKFKNKEYKWNVAAFSFSGGSGEKITAEEASLDQNILAKILKIEGQGLLTELV